MFNLEQVRVEETTRIRGVILTSYGLGNQSPADTGIFLEELIEQADSSQVVYNARVYVRDALEHVVKGEMQIVVPYSIYGKYYPKSYLMKTIIRRQSMF